MTNLPALRTPEDAIAAAAALVEIERLSYAMHELVNSPAAVDMSHRVFAYLSEATWWIASLNEQFIEVNKDGSYARARDADDSGRLILGIVWVRDRISHQLPFTVSPDTRSMFAPKPGGVLHISAGYEWLPIEQIRSGRRYQDREQVYREQFAEQGVVSGPAQIAVFFRALLERDAACRIELERIASIG